MEPGQEKVGEKRALEPITDPNEPAEKKVKLDTNETKNITPNVTNTPDTSVPMKEGNDNVSLDIPKEEEGNTEQKVEKTESNVPTILENTTKEESTNDESAKPDPALQNLDFSTISSITEENAPPTEEFTKLANEIPQAPPTESGGIPYPPGYDPLQNNFIASPLAAPATTTRRTRRKKAEIIYADDYEDPESKWSTSASERMIALYNDFGKRQVLDEKLRNGLLACLDRGGNPAVTLMSRDGMNFFTYLTVAAECGDMGLVKIFIGEHREEFSDYDVKASLKAALTNREQEIAEYLLRETEVIPDRETVMEMFDIQMNDESERKILPLRAFLDRCVDTGKYPGEEFFLPEVLNRAIYAHNVAALELLFERNKEEFLPLLEVATPDAKIIRSGRSKSQDLGEGVPPLAYAAVMERGECLEVFLKNGANPNFICNDMGGTLLHIVGFKGNTELIQLLIEHDADPRIVNERNVDILSRTKGRKSRKLIIDAVQRLNQLDGISEIPPLPHHAGSSMDSSVAAHLRNTMNMNMGENNHHHHHHQYVSLPSSLQNPIVLSSGAAPINFNSMMSNDDENSFTPPELQSQMAQPPPFANQPNNPGVEVPRHILNTPFAQHSQMQHHAQSPFMSHPSPNNSQTSFSNEPVASSIPSVNSLVSGSSQESGGNINLPPPSEIPSNHLDREPSSDLPSFVETAPINPTPNDVQPSQVPTPSTEQPQEISTAPPPSSSFPQPITPAPFAELQSAASINQSKPEENTSQPMHTET